MSELAPKTVKSDPYRRLGDSELKGKLAVREILPVVADQQPQVGSI